MREIFFLMIMNIVLAVEWLQYNGKFDCAANIFIDEKPAAIGVFISDDMVLTSANPFNHLEGSTEKVKVKGIQNVYNDEVTLDIHTMKTNLAYRNDVWIAMGYEAIENTCIHDLGVLYTGGKKDDSGLRRKPYYVTLANITHEFVPSNLAFAGFGYIDENHVENSSILETTYSRDLVTNCDEWIPREWGRFICLLDDQNLYSLASGAPLFFDNEQESKYTLYGVGSFSLTKGKDKVLVFTDIRPYESLINSMINER